MPTIDPDTGEVTIEDGEECDGCGKDLAIDDGLIWGPEEAYHIGCQPDDHLSDDAEEALGS